MIITTNLELSKWVTEDLHVGRPASSLVFFQLVIAGHKWITAGDDYIAYLLMDGNVVDALP